MPEYDIHAAARHIDKTVAARIKALRKQKGFTQTECANELGITFQQFQKYELAKNRVSASKLYLIADLFGVPIQDFFAGVDTYAPPADTEQAA